MICMFYMAKYDVLSVSAGEDKLLLHKIARNEKHRVGHDLYYSNRDTLHVEKRRAPFRKRIARCTDREDKPKIAVVAAVGPLSRHVAAVEDDEPIVEVVEV